MDDVVVQVASGMVGHGGIWDMAQIQCPPPPPDGYTEVWLLRCRICGALTDHIGRPVHEAWHTERR